MIPYQHAVNVISIEITCRSLQEPPIPAFIVGDVCLHLVVVPLVCNQHAFNPCYLININSRLALRLTFLYLILH